MCVVYLLHGVIDNLYYEEDSSKRDIKMEMYLEDECC